MIKILYDVKPISIKDKAVFKNTGFKAMAINAEENVITKVLFETLRSYLNKYSCFIWIQFDESLLSTLQQYFDIIGYHESRSIGFLLFTLPECYFELTLDKIESFIDLFDQFQSLEIYMIEDIDNSSMISNLKSHPSKLDIDYLKKVLMQNNIIINKSGDEDELEIIAYKYDLNCFFQFLTGMICKI